jgi:ElaB/YqjD/DUF883 family membrane-anchored ribosome-binding protein
MAAAFQVNENGSPLPNGGLGKDVTDDIDSLRRDIASLANSVSNLASDKLGAAAGDAQALAGEKLADVEGMIRRNPTQAALIAVGVGFVAGLMFTR